MIIKDHRGNELLEIIFDDKDTAVKKYSPIRHCLAVVKIGDRYLVGWNNYRNHWEIFGGCIEENETPDECIQRECREELGIENAGFSYIGLMYYKLAPGYFNPGWHYEYGALYGVTLPEGYIETINARREDKEEIGRLAFYDEVKDSEIVNAIDEKLMEYWK